MDVLVSRVCSSPSWMVGIAFRCRISRYLDRIAMNEVAAAAYYGNRKDVCDADEFDRRNEYHEGERKFNMEKGVMCSMVVDFTVIRNMKTAETRPG
jgi:hypothetical protein